MRYIRVDTRSRFFNIVTRMISMNKNSGFVTLKDGTKSEFILHKLITDEKTITQYIIKIKGE